MQITPLAAPVAYLLVTAMFAAVMLVWDALATTTNRGELTVSADLDHFAAVVTDNTVRIPLDVVTEDADDFGARDPHFFEAAAALGLAAEDVQIITEADIDLFSEVDDWTEAYSLDADDYHAFLADIYSDDRFDDIDA